MTHPALRLLAFLLVAGATAAAAPAPPAPPERVVVVLRAQASLAGITGGHAARLREVVRRRRETADRGFAAFRSRLAAWQRAGAVGAIRRLWVVDAFAMSASRAVIAELARDPEVARIVPDAAPIVPAAGATPEWNVARVGAPSVWDLGDTGQGVVVATLDSGVDVGHADLATRWRGGPGGWYDPFGQHPGTPADLSGHGTQVMGVILGGDAGGTAVGVAPGAKWIAARIFDDQGGSTLSATHLAFQWLLDPDGDPATADAPQVVNASWSFASPGCNLEFAADIQSLRAAGILPVFAAGNFGTASASPANNPGALAVGSTSSTDAIATDSSRGPSACGEPSTTFPEIAAPGVGIHTTDLGGLYATQSGTSLAAPHVAGALALLLSARPGLTVGRQEAALEGTAVDLGAPGPDNTFGHGRLDVLAAYRAVIAAPPPDTAGPVTSTVAVTPGTAAAGPVALTAAAVDAAGVTAAAEWFDGADPGNGHGVPMTAADLAFDGPSEALTATIDATPMSPGAHVIAVRARDAAGNWGAPATTTLTIDRSGPAVTAVAAPPGPTNVLAPKPYDLPAGSAASFALTATADDGAVAHGEWFAGADPGPGRGTPMTAAGSHLAATIDFVALGWLDGARTVSVRARDAAGNWGAPAQAPVTVVRPNVIFRDGFERGDASGWSAAAGTGRLAFDAGAGGMRVRLTGPVLATAPASAAVIDDSPRAEPAYHARFAIVPAGSRPGGGSAGIAVLAASPGDHCGGGRRLAVRYRRRAGRAQVRLGVARRGGETATRWFTIPDAAPTTVEVDWRAGASVAAHLRLEGTIVQTLNRLDTGPASRVESACLGALGLSRSGGGRGGRLALGTFASTRRTAIGRPSPAALRQLRRLAAWAGERRR